MSASTLNSGQTVAYGIYKCVRCGISYTVLDGGWSRCTPEFCHVCVACLANQYALLPYPEPVH